MHSSIILLMSAFYRNQKYLQNDQSLLVSIFFVFIDVYGFITTKSQDPSISKCRKLRNIKSDGMIPFTLVD